MYTYSVYVEAFHVSRIRADFLQSLIRRVSRRTHIYIFRFARLFFSKILEGRGGRRGRRLLVLDTKFIAMGVLKRR